MAPLTISYTVLDVFTQTPWSRGNPLAIVPLNSTNPALITQEQKQLIAREFNFSETTFLYVEDDENGSGGTTRIKFDIFTKTVEVPFAGHPTIGTAFYCFEHVFPRGTTEGGTGEVHRFGKGLILKEEVLESHPELETVGSTLQDGYQIISIAKGLYFVPIEVPSLEVMATLRPAKPPPMSHLLDYDFAGAIGGLMFYHELSREGLRRTFRVRRMTSLGEEDPATGSAACAFGVWMSGKRGISGPFRYEIEQGVEMGRASTIVVDVDFSTDGKPEKVVLSGHAVRAMKGELNI
ncbi:Diaminopimelate epimerase-like protein [Tothia fuscella]|uniref:Diaminopimelate epimerase-like protein n=1 Tax=Tothia fuscella TaxID=1048955 RepID=A0A9P4TT90_9PEZI|nr:Diaminopimelate epimerase-like protein [Tothia fuscella]